MNAALAHANSPRSVLALAGLLLSFALTATYVRADVLDEAIPAPTWTKTVGDLQVARYGDGAPALVLVPGLASGPWTWTDTIAREHGKHALYVVTIPGFDGLAAKPGVTFESIEASLATLIAAEKLDRPVVVGHSLGGHLALRFGIEHSALVRGIVSVDGLPVFPVLANATPDVRSAAGAQFAASIENATPEQFAAGEKKTVADFVVDPALADRVAALTAKSDPHAVGAFGKALFAADLRPQLAALTAPTLLIAPVPAPPLPSYLPATMAQQTQDERRAATVAFYTALLAGAPHVTIVPIDAARHFVMLDRPDAFAAALDGFLATLP